MCSFWQRWINAITSKLVRPTVVCWKSWSTKNTHDKKQFAVFQYYSAWVGSESREINNPQKKKKTKTNKLKMNFEQIWRNSSGAENALKHCFCHFWANKSSLHVRMYANPPYILSGLSRSHHSHAVQNSLTGKTSLIEFAYATDILYAQNENQLEKCEWNVGFEGMQSVSRLAWSLCSGNPPAAQWDCIIYEGHLYQ